MAEDPLSDRYQMLEELGSGSFGTVYKAIEKSTGEIVAVKHIDLESTDEDLQEVQAEISLLSTCASPFVTQYKASFLRGYKLWIVMEYLGGGSCQDLLKPGVFSEAHIAIVCQQILLGLDYLHQEGKLHRDIKAANILLSQSGKVKLADFGVAAQLVNIRSLRNTFVGTPFWMAPEVIQQSGYDFKADVWSLGITAVELIHGEPPNAGKHPMKVLMEIPKMPAPRLEGAQYSKDFKDFVAKCLIKDPDQRPSAKDMLKHKFIRNAGRTEALQELILRRQEWEAGQEKRETLKYYAETLRNVKVLVEEEDDEWVFDTVRAVSTVHQTQKKRKLMTSGGADDVREDEATDMMEELQISQEQQQQRQAQAQPSTMRRIQDPVLAPTVSPSVRGSAKKRISSGQQKQPLGINMSFGNSPSTVRQFRRVSPTAIENNDASSDSTQASLSPSKHRISTQLPSSASTQKMPPPPLPARKLGRISSLSQSTSTHFAGSTNAVTASNVHSEPKPSPFTPRSSSANSKEANLGRLLYDTAIGSSCQEILNTTADSTKRQALSRLAEAFSDLETVDPEGLYHVVKGTVERMGGDQRLRGLLPQASDPVVQASEATGGRTSKEPRQQKPSGGTGGGCGAAAAAAKLVLAQNNPHLKSHHRRRQSAQVVVPAPGQTNVANTGDEMPMTSSPRAVAAIKETKEAREEEKAVRALMRDTDKENVDVDDEVDVNVKGMEHVRLLGNVLFDRWCEGLRVRWGGGANGANPIGNGP